MNTNQSSPFQKLYSHLNPQNQKQKLQKHILTKKTSILQPAQKLSYHLFTNQKSNLNKIQQHLKQQVHHLSLVHQNQTINRKSQDLDQRQEKQVGTTVSPLNQNKNQM